MAYTIEKIREVINGSYLKNNQRFLTTIEHIQIDSRKIVFPDSSIFIAIEGVNQDGHKFINEAYKEGIRSFIINENKFDHDAYSSLTDVTIIGVENTLNALHQISSYHRKQFKFPIIAVTGSNGKTVVKDWLNFLLNQQIETVCSPKSFNSQVGVPLSVWQINKTHRLGIFEAGISEPDEMKKLEEIIKPDIGIFTMLGPAHDGGFKNREYKLTEKLTLFKNSKVLVFNVDDEVVANQIRLFSSKNAIKLYTWTANNNESDLKFSILKKENETVITYSIHSENFSIFIPFIDEASISNSCTCIAALSVISQLGLEIKTDPLLFANLPTVDLRLQLIEGINNCQIINDSYNSDIGSLKIALDFLKHQDRSKKRTIILSDILESGKNIEDLYKEVSKLLKESSINRLIGIGKSISSNPDLFSCETMFFDTTEDFLSKMTFDLFRHETILLKGARKFSFEKISKILEKKIHETVFEINMNALVNNLNVYKSKLRPEVKLMAMVKAFSYGAGTHEIAKLLEFNNVDYLGVAYFDEGVALRQAGIKTPIMIMNPDEKNFDSALKYNLEPEIYNFQILESLINTCNGETCSVHIEIDSGMKRLGFEESEIDALLEILKSHQNIVIKSVFTHLVGSEDSQLDNFTDEQIEKFDLCASIIRKELDYNFIKHCLNSSGIVRFDNAQMDMVRLGIGLYGIDPSATIQNKLIHIGKLKTVISQIRKITAEETVGYNRKGFVTKASTIATVAIGYADGYSRKFGNGNFYMMVNSQPAKVIGNVCMDMCMIDVTGINCKVGDEVTVLAQKPSVAEMAEVSGTIPYEILTSISQRVKRIYYYE